ncbi:tetratricopeptide repeat protein [Halospina denitrificans]|uniref:Tetratricopeptide repeat protein n=1 Tax=Halospina denitrificans TaxID=332522 RepID=A0A4R7JHI5_9GAMM|nr:tetratricopeptide repeat protein [Halospina denitrificans]TDT37085.1 tetratricopeptide repeat protein [Halospina denitrificans]
MKRRLPPLILILVMVPLTAVASVKLQEGAETLGDLRPLVIRIDDRPLPDIALEDAVQRYVAVFESMSDPETRIAVLNRIQNLQFRFGDNLGLSEAESQRLHRKALPDFETLLAENDMAPGERDRLLYEAARASDIAGEPSSSINYLETLMADHPDSGLVPEAAFRVGEYRFSGGQHHAAVDAFHKAVDTAEDAGFRERATYMLGWSQFLDERREAASDTFIGFLDTHHNEDSGFDHLTGKAREQVDDSMRVLSLIAAYGEGPPSMARMIQRQGGRPYEAQLFHRLMRFYRDNSRYQDSVDTARYFLERNPGHTAAPLMADEIVRSWTVGGYPGKAREAKATFIEDYGDAREMAALDGQRRNRLMGFLKELGVWHYRQGQSGTGSAREAFGQASRYLEQWADHQQRFSVGNRFETPGLMLLLAGDASQQAGESARAIELYQRAAYEAPPFPAAREAGYALVQLRHDRWRGQGDRESLLNQLVADADRFVATFPESPRIPSVRHELANILYDNDRLENAERVARALVEADGGGKHERAGWIVIGHVALERGAYPRAEKAWNETLALTAADDDRRPDFKRRLAVSVYRQGEAAREAGEMEEALRHYDRVSRVAPETETAIRASFDYGGLLLELERWDEAIMALSTFRDEYPEHRLSGRISERLVFAHLESGDPGQAADEMLAHEPAELSGSELWEYRLEAAGHYRDADRLFDAASLYESFLAEGSRALGDHEFHQERRHDLIRISAELDRSGALADWHSRLLEAERNGPGTDRSEYLASQSALWLGRRAADEFEAIGLKAPLKESLPRKRDAMEVAVNYFQEAEKYGFAETATESTYRLAELYRQLAEDVMDSDRPQGLTDLQADQYEMLLEEQAYPFEEKAIELHQRNQERIAEGHWTPWVSQSLSTLAEMFPARYQRKSLWMEARNESGR